MSKRRFLSVFIMLGLVIGLGVCTSAGAAEQDVVEYDIQDPQITFVTSEEDIEPPPGSPANVPPEEAESELAKAYKAVDPPQTLINYQGTLLSGGSPVTGTVSMTFTIYNESSSGTAIWTETRNVQVTDGLFTVMLGESTPLWNKVASFQNQLYLGVKPGGGTELTPRHKFGVSPYAMSLIPGATIDDDNPAGGYVYSFWVSSANHHAIYGRSSTLTGVTGVTYDADYYGGNFYNNADGVDIYASGSGKIKSVAESVFVATPMNIYTAIGSMGDLTFYRYSYGYTQVQTSYTGSEWAFVPINIPTQVFGMQQKLKKVKLFYSCNTASSYIDDVWVKTLNADGTDTDLFEYNGDLDYDAGWGSLTFTTGTPKTFTGPIHVMFKFNFDGTGSSHYIRIGRIEFTLVE